MRSFLFPILMLSLLIGGEYYMYQAIKLTFPPKVGERFSWAQLVYLSLNIFLYASFITYRVIGPKLFSKAFISYISAVFMMLMVAKIVVLLFFFLGDIYRLIIYSINKVSAAPSENVNASPNGISRSAFLGKVALLTASVPFAAMLYGVIVNAYNYQFKKVTLKFPNLPAAFDGFRFVQISDIHSGSFNRTEPLIEVVKKINALNADAILFTGDLVNNTADEMEPYMQIFDKLEAKHGVLSITGNHDYGDYVPWNTGEEKKANFERFKEVHKNLGWRLLMNENQILERDGEKIAILGIENWGHALNFPRYGKMKEAHKGTEDIPFKILMSHDPSHWDAQVRTEYPDIDLTLSGHTHGFQFGIETKYFKWSPSQFVYKQWAGLYNEGKQYIYVNRGFGFLGYPGRVGILPEVTEITLRRA
jgi:hypothetical protein